LARDRLKPDPERLLVRSEPAGGRTCQSIPDAGQTATPQKCFTDHSLSSHTITAWQTKLRLNSIELAFLHLGVGDEHLPQVFEHAGPAERAVGHGDAGHLRDGAHAEQLILRVARQGAHQLA